MFVVRGRITSHVLTGTKSGSCNTLALTMRFSYAIREIVSVPPTTFLPRPAMASAILGVEEEGGPTIGITSHGLFFHLIGVKFKRQEGMFAGTVGSNKVDVRLKGGVLRETKVSNNHQKRAFSVRRCTTLTGT